MSHRRGPWSQAEDNYLVQMVHAQGPLNWVRIAQLIGSRSPKQCRERYHQNLKPTLNHDPITPEEGLLIERLVGEMGKRWAEIARRLNGRSDNAVKNWWNGSMNRRRRLVLRRRSSGHGPDPHDEQPHPPAMQPLNTQAAAYSTVRGDMALPSPACSDVSRAESFDTPPSLISDTGSIYSASPRLAASPQFSLPPLDTISARMDRRSSHPLHQSALDYSPTSSESQNFSYRLTGDPKMAVFPISYPLQHPSPRESAAPSRLHRAPSPALSHVQLAPLQLGQTPSVPRDARMSLSTLMD